MAAAGLAAPIAFGAVTNQRVEWWASWGQWVGGVGSILAAVAAVGIAVKGWRRADTQLKHAEEREYATKFLVWIEHISQEDYRVVYMNAGPLPVFGVQVTIFLGDRSIGDFLMGDLSPVTSPTAREPSTNLVAFWVEKEAERQAGRPLVDVNEVIRNPQGAKPDRSVVMLYRKIAMDIRFALAFEDGNRVRWGRAADGELRKISG